ncbi:MAG: hypothetical protein QXN67_01065 [Thermoproteota archaeon]
MPANIDMIMKIAEKNGTIMIAIVLMFMMFFIRIEWLEPLDVPKLTNIRLADVQEFNGFIS